MAEKGLDDKMPDIHCMESGETSEGPITRFPLELMFRILSLCHLKDLFRSCIRVNRKWETSTRSVLMTWKTVMIGWPEHLVGNHADNLSIPRDEDIDSMIRSLDQMQRIESFAVKLGSTDAYAEFIRSRAHVLQNLQVDELPLGSGVVYPRLTSLKIGKLDAETVTACPQLRRLRVQDMIESEDLILSLPAEQLECIFRMDVSANIVSPVADYLLKMQNLTCLGVQFKGPLSAADQEMVCKLVSGVKNLTLLRVWTNRRVFKCCDEEVERLVHQNPGLKAVMLSYLTLTDNSLFSLSRLQNLEFLILQATKNSLSVEALLYLLNGPSQHSLRKVHFYDAIEETENVTPLEADPSYARLFEETTHELDVNPENPAKLSYYLTLTKT